MADIDMRDPAFKTLTPIITQLRKRADTRLLVAGGRPSMFPEAIRSLSRVEFWHSNEHSQRTSGKTVPDRIDAIVFNKFLDHTLTNNLRNESRRLNIPMHNVPLGLGVIEGLIKHTGLDQEVAIVTDAPAEEPHRPAYGAIRAFLSAEADFTLTTGTGAEIDRLFKLSQERGLNTTRNSINSSYYSLRKLRDEQAFPRSAFSNPPKLTIITPAGSAEVTPLQVPEYIESEREPEASDVAGIGSLEEILAEPPKPLPIPKPAEVLQLLDDAIAGLQLARDAVKAIEPTLAEADEARTLIAQMRKMLGVS